MTNKTGVKGLAQVRPKKISSKQRVARVRNIAIARSKKQAAMKTGSSDNRGIFVRKTKMVRGKVVNIDKWVSNADEARRYIKSIGSQGVKTYRPAKTGITNQYQTG